jgi:hypothetical protein
LPPAKQKSPQVVKKVKEPKKNLLALDSDNDFDDDFFNDKEEASPKAKAPTPKKEPVKEANKRRRRSKPIATEKVKEPEAPES